MANKRRNPRPAFSLTAVEPGTRAVAVQPLQVRLLAASFYRGFSWHWQNHAAPYWRFYWNPQGGASLFLDGAEYPLRPAEFMLIPPNTAFFPRSYGPMDHFFVHFLVGAPYEGVAPGITTGPAGAADTAFLRLLMAELEAGAVLAPAAQARLLAVLFTALSWLPAAALVPPRSESRLDKVLAHLDTHASEPLQNVGLARLAGMSTSTFVRVFRRQTGLTPHQHLGRLRVDKACLMLHFSDAGIKEVAAACGFCDRHHFTRTFVRWRGVTPAAFRRQRPVAGGKGEANMTGRGGT